MIEHPILFSGEMVRAILEGRKTQTRRVVKQNPHGKIPFTNELPCPYGNTGDHLWVRETFVLEQWDDEPKPPTDRKLLHHIPEEYNEFDNEYWLWPYYKATDKAPDLFYEDEENNEPKCRWQPSIHMPRWASRINLEIVKMAIGRVQEISEDDAIAEGVDYLPSAPAALTHYTAFAGLWNTINAKRGYGWDINPWVWIIYFKVSK